MAERLYYTDPGCLEFDATVTAVSRIDGRPAAALDTTAFYPTSGGQPFDTGTLGEARVLDVVESDDGRVWHLLDREIETGKTVHGTIDRERRLDHMQQHTGQHILSAAFDRLYGARTVGFHLGAAVSTVDLSIDLPAEAIAAAESDANRVVWEDRPVAIRFASAEEAAKLPLRKGPERAGVLRLIEVEGYDLSACGGTHVPRTGAIGLVAVLSAERLRGGTRLEFVCGGRALRALRLYRDTVAGCIRSVSVAPEDLPAAIERLQTESKDQRKLTRDLQDRLAVYQARELAASAEDAGGVRQVVRAIDGKSQSELKTMAQAICESPGVRVALFSTAEPHVAVVARSKDGKADCAVVVKALVAAFGGRGGGRPELAQCGGLAGDLQPILAAARAGLSGER